MNDFTWMLLVAWMISQVYCKCKCPWSGKKHKHCIFAKRPTYAILFTHHFLWKTNLPWGCMCFLCIFKHTFTKGFHLNGYNGWWTEMNFTVRFCKHKFTFVIAQYKTNFINWPKDEFPQKNTTFDLDKQFVQFAQKSVLFFHRSPMWRKRVRWS